MILLTFTLSESGLHSSMPLGVKYLLWNTIENSRNVYMIIKIKHSHFIRTLNNAHVSFPPFYYSAYQPASLSFAFIAILLKIKKKIQASVIFSTFTSRVDEVKGKTWLPVFKYEKLGKSYKIFINKR